LSVVNDDSAAFNSPLKLINKRCCFSKLLSNRRKFPSMLLKACGESGTLPSGKDSTHRTACPKTGSPAQHSHKSGNNNLLVIHQLPPSGFWDAAGQSR
jgi:hypothetical protein